MERKEIELRCEEVQDILTRPPHALVRWGITVFFAVLAIFFVGGCCFKGELTGTAEVMTDERSVTGRLLSPLRYLWEKYN